MPRKRGYMKRKEWYPGPFADAVMVVHGPEAFDQGDVAFLQDLLSPGKTVVAGVMARTAAEESGLPVTFDSDVPSSVIGRTGGKVFLVNHGKTTESGRIFGEIVASHLPTESSPRPAGMLVADSIRMERRRSGIRPYPCRRDRILVRGGSIGAKGGGRIS